MKKRKLLEVLKDLHDDAEINYREPNFGGRGEDFDASDVEIKNGEAFINCPFWEEVD